MAKSSALIGKGKLHIYSTFNNTILTLTDLTGNAVASKSCGKMGFKGPKKGTPYAAKTAGEAISSEAKSVGFKEVDIYIKGVGAGREPAIRAVQSSGISILSITDITPIPHNGTRKKKRRRV
jgi:small subunit ribosomal protein S11